MLDAFQFCGFKSYRDATLPLGPLTVLIGANASGKSNAIEAIRLLSWLAQGSKLASIQYAVHESDRVVRGRIQDLGYCGTGSFTLGCTLGAQPTVTPFDHPHTLSLTIALKPDDLHITQEEVKKLGSGVPLYQLSQPAEGRSTDVRVAYNNFTRGGKKPLITCTDQCAIFTQLESPAQFGADHSQARAVIPAVTGMYRNLLEHILFLDPVPAKMRGYCFLSDKTLRSDASTLSSTLYELCENDPDHKSDNRQSILSFVASLPEQDISGITFLRGPRDEVMVQLEETFGGTVRTYDAALLSDGTLRVLAVAAAMLAAPAYGMVVIEEFDNGIHPSRAHHLLDNIRRIAEQRHLRILLTSHNPAMLDALPDAAVPDVVFCYRDPLDGASQLLRLQDFADYPELMAQGRLGHLMTSGILDRFIKADQGPEAKKRNALAWLERLTSPSAP